MLSGFKTDETEAARARHRDSSKEFACFISLHTQTCSEVRLVKEGLESILDAKVFIGK